LTKKEAARIQREREEAERIHREQQEARQKAAADAAKKARELLEGALDDAERKELTEKGSITLVAKSGRKYRLKFGTHGNIEELDKDEQPIARLCVQPEGVPVGDAVLAQRLWLKHDEDGIRKAANITPLRRSA